MQVIIDIPQASIDAFVQTGYLSKEVDPTPAAVMEVLDFFITVNAQSLATAIDFKRWQGAKRDERNAQRDRELRERRHEEWAARRAAI